MQLLANVAGRDRVLAAPEASGRISTACDKLPLAPRIAGARLKTRPGVAVTMLAERLEDERAALRNWRSVTCPCTTGCGRATEHSIQWPAAPSARSDPAVRRYSPMPRPNNCSACGGRLLTGLWRTSCATIC